MFCNAVMRFGTDPDAFDGVTIVCFDSGFEVLVFLEQQNQSQLNTEARSYLKGKGQHLSGDTPLQRSSTGSLAASFWFPVNQEVAIDYDTCLPAMAHGDTIQYHPVISSFKGEESDDERAGRPKDCERKLGDN
eukprot:2553787-Amphidinium_carterae.1